MNIRAWFLLVLVFVTTGVFAAPIQFEDTSDKLGFERGAETWGLSWGDLDMDNYPDLWNSGHRDFHRLYKNAGNGDFDDVAMLYDRNQNGVWIANTQKDMHGSAFADFDNDGDDDILIGDSDELYTNQADSGGFFVFSPLAANQQYAAWNNTDGDRELESDRSCGGGAGVSRGGQYILLFDVDVNGTVDEVCGSQ